MQIKEIALYANKTKKLYKPQQKGPIAATIFPFKIIGKAIVDFCIIVPFSARQVVIVTS